mmetsp:Transcript_5022/g.8500  ORF Transcript_5022/g.8500 Transcript_5022/m.8500 type:complete len:206 (+) Transcript_5022:22-639(+)
MAADEGSKRSKDMDIYSKSKRRKELFQVVHHDELDASAAIDDYIEKETALQRSEEIGVNDADSNSDEEHKLERKKKRKKKKKRDHEKEEMEEDANEERRVIAINDEPKSVKQTDVKMSHKLSSSYHKVVRKGGGLKLRFKDKCDGESKLLAIKKTIDKKAKNKKMKAKKQKEKALKKQNRFDKYKTAEQLLDERVKKKHDKFAWC